MIELETIAILGIDALPVAVQVEIVKTIPSFVIVGMVSRAINESKERIRGAFNSSSISFPNGKIIVNLSPADVLKEGSHYDLSIAVGILSAMGRVKVDLKDTIIFGELSLNGDIIKTKDLLPAALYCYKYNKKFLIHEKHYQEAKTIFQDKSHLIIVCNSLSQLLSMEQLIPYYITVEGAVQQETRSVTSPETIDVFENIVGNLLGKRACALAVAGRHNIMLFGPPGSGKSLLSRSMEKFKIRLSREKSLIVSSIYSAASLLPSGQLIELEPFRNPHHSLSYAALLGGGSAFRPGEISLAHYGVLFFDEVAEFDSQTLDMLRQVMEDKKIVISRTNYNVCLPADFQLVCTMNPCKCGFFGDPSKNCRCGLAQVQKYQRRISGPLMDRIDMRILISNNQYNKMTQTPSGSYFYNRVIKARERQLNRYKLLSSPIEFNSAIKEEHIIYLNIPTDGKDLVQKFVEENFLSHRKFLKILGLARTIADFEEEEQVSKDHLLESIFLSCKMEY